MQNDHAIRPIPTRHVLRVCCLIPRYNNVNGAALQRPRLAWSHSRLARDEVRSEGLRPCTSDPSRPPQHKPKPTQDRSTTRGDDPAKPPTTLCLHGTGRQVPRGRSQIAESTVRGQEWPVRVGDVTAKRFSRFRRIFCLSQIYLI